MSLMDTLSTLATCVCDALKAPRDDTDTPGWDGDCCIQPGSQVAFDSCCESGGQMWIIASGGYMTDRFPQPTLANNPRCDTGFVQAVRVEVGAIRCVCYDQCDCDVKEENADKIIKDLEAMLIGITCCFTNDSSNCGGLGWWITSWDLIGPEGGCGGVRIQILVEQPLPCCPES